MRMLSIFVGVIVCLSSFVGLSARSIRTPGDPKSLSSSSHKKKHGDFIMIGTGKNDSIILGNNIFYQPAHKHDVKKTRDWQVNDPIRVIKTKDDKRFILLNRRTGESMKAKILRWS